MSVGTARLAWHGMARQRGWCAAGHSWPFSFLQPLYTLPNKPLRTLLNPHNASHLGVVVLEAGPGAQGHTVGSVWLALRSGRPRGFVALALVQAGVALSKLEGAHAAQQLETVPPCWRQPADLAQLLPQGLQMGPCTHLGGVVKEAGRVPPALALVLDAPAGWRLFVRAHMHV